MKFPIGIFFVFLWGSGLAQDPWKNIYSEQAWAARDKWQRSEDLLRMLKIAHGSGVADIGCHEGYMTFKLARQVGETGLVYAVDIEQGKLDKVRKRADQHGIAQIRTVKGDRDNPKLPSGMLDAVIILDTYHEMAAHAKILQHVKASLKKGGRLLICEPIADERRSLSRSEQEKKHEIALEFAVADLKEAGFTIVYQKDNFVDRTKEKGDRMWVVVAEKM